MGVRRILLFTFILVAGTPFAGAVDPFREAVCVDSDSCVGAGSCVADVGCVPRGCDPLDCRGQVAPPEAECAVNATIDGRTCAAYVGASLGTGDGSGGAFVDAGSSNGSVEDLNLPNTWISPGAEAYVNILGFDLGYYYVYLYTSEITTEGPRGGPVGSLSASANHTWTQVGVSAGGAGQDATAAVELLDYVPEGCFVRSPRGTVPDIDCPSFAPLYP